MKFNQTFTTILISSACLVIASTSAEAKNLPKGAKKMTDAQALQIFPNRTFRGTVYGKNGKKAGTYVLEYAAGGKKNVKVSLKGKKTFRTTVKWYVKGPKFCQFQISEKKMVCGVDGNVYVSKGMCHVSYNGKTINSEFKC